MSADEATTSVDITGPDVTGPVVSNIATSSITTTTATISWETHENTASSYFDYGLATSSMNTTVEEDYGLINHQVSLSSLSENTYYYFQIRSTDDLGNTSTYNYMTSGSDYMFKTAVNPPPVISNVSSSNRTQTSITIFWTTNENATSYVDYGTSTTNLNLTTGTSSLVTAHKISLTGLSQGTVYYYQVRSADGAGKSTTDNNSGSYYHFTTRGPEIITSNVEVDPLETTSATINWDTNEAVSSTVDYGQATSSLDTTVSDSNSTTSHALSLTGLTENTHYYYQIRGTDTIGDSFTDNNSGNYYSFTTPTTPEPETETAGGSVYIPPDEEVDIGNLKIYLNNGAAYTNNENIQISFRNFSEFSQVKISDKQDFLNTDWQVIQKEIPWTLLSDDGKKTLYFKLQKNNQTTDVLERSIVLDTTRPAAPVNFQVDYIDNQVVLNWQYPAEADVAGIRIFKSNIDYITNPFNREGVVFEGKADKAFDRNINLGTVYYYSAFIYDYARNYSAPAIAQILPLEPSLPQKPPLEDVEIPEPAEEPPVEISQPKPIQEDIYKSYESYKRKPQVVDQDIQRDTVTIEPSPFREKLKQEEVEKIYEIPDFGFQEIHYLEKKPLIIKLRKKNLNERMIDKLILKVGNEAQYILESGKDYWQSKIETPAGKADYNLLVEVIYTNKTRDILPVGRLLVDPYGYVYQKAIEPHARLFTGDLFHWEFIESKNYLSKAKVTLYQLNQESSAWERFISDTISQQNPQLTDQEGNFGFMVPNGIYYLSIEKEGFGSINSSAFQVNNHIVNKNILLSTAFIAWWQVPENIPFILIIFVLIVLVAIIIFKFIIKSKLLKK